eukprot:8943801-Heterocapsa_arctica.AAC.1
MRNLPRVWDWNQLGSACPDSTGTISRWAPGSPVSGGRPIEPANMGTSGAVPGRWRHAEGARRPKGLLAF